LEADLLTIAGEFARLPAVPFPQGWQQTVAKQLGLQPESLLQCFIDVDGEPLVERLVGLCREAQRKRAGHLVPVNASRTSHARGPHHRPDADEAVAAGRHVHRVLATPHGALNSAKSDVGRR
jgi:hypothetical protein